jgi:hypothetical protein
MSEYTLLIDTNSNTREIAEQERARFVKTIIECLELPIEYNLDKYADIEEKVKLRQSLNKYRIFLIEDYDGGLQIFHENDLIAQWNKCRFKLKEDVASRDPKHKLYMEMAISCWSMFEEPNGKKADNQRT